MSKIPKHLRIEHDLTDITFRKIVDVINDLPTKPGLYRIYNKRRKLIYVGISKNIKKRIKGHLGGYTGNLGLTKQMYYIKVHKIDIESARILEDGFMNLIDPFFNNLKSWDRYCEGKFEARIFFPWEKPYFSSKCDFYARREFLDAQRDKRFCIESSHTTLGIPRIKKMVSK